MLPELFAHPRLTCPRHRGALRLAPVQPESGWLTRYGCPECGYEVAE